MNTPLQVYFIRHGETEWSRSGRHTSHTDLPLTPKGEAMARQLSEALKNIEFTQVWTSPRVRASSTCELAGLTQAQIEVDLVEWNYGDFEGLRSSEILLLQPEWNLWEHGSPGGESPAQVAARADALITRLLSCTGKVALFSHGHFGRALAARWIGLALRAGQHFALDPASISILGFEAHHPQTRVIRLWNASASGEARI